MTLCNSNSRCSQWGAGEIGPEALRSQRLFGDLQVIRIPDQSSMAVFLFVGDAATDPPIASFDSGTWSCTLEACRRLTRIVVTGACGDAGREPAPRGVRD